jgi:hypothetical protein
MAQGQRAANGQAQPRSPSVGCERPCALASTCNLSSTSRVVVVSVWSKGGMNMKVTAALRHDDTQYLGLTTGDTAASKSR